MTAITVYEKSTSFIWQHLLLVMSMFVMTLGVALSVRSNVGSSVISSIPFVMALAGENGSVPSLTIGEYTYLMNALLVAFQIIILRRQFQAVQLFQLAIGFVFGYLLDINMTLTSFLRCETLPVQLAVQLAGCLILAVGISLEIRCGSVTMPGEGIPVAVCKAWGIPFPKAKIIVDTIMVACAVGLGYFFFGRWLWNVVGIGTIMAMVFVGGCIKFMAPYMDWFNRLVESSPGHERHIYGLARFIYRRFN